MRVFYWRIKKMVGLQVCLLILVCVAVLFLKFNIMNTPVVAEPYYQGAETNPVISLAFNVDWGDEYLPGILQVLDQYDVKATFFLTGRWTHNHQALALEIAKAGHEIGNHAYSHKSPNGLSYEQNKEEITKTAIEIKKATGIDPVLYAPPSGERDDHVLRAAEDLGYSTILWSVDTIDWQRPSPQIIVQRVEKKIHNGAIILAHPTDSTLKALPTLLADLTKGGYSFVTVSRNLGLNDIVLDEKAIEKMLVSQITEGQVGFMNRQIMNNGRVFYE